jgi:hypothetical protein
MKTARFVIALALPLLLLSSFATLQSQELLTSFDEFLTAAKKGASPEFSELIEASIESYELPEYHADFSNGGQGILTFKLEAHRGSVWMNGPYAFHETQAEFTVMGGLAMLLIELPDLDAMLMIASNKLMEKHLLEAVAEKSMFLTLTPKAVDWPAVIPVNYRLKGTLIMANVFESTTDGYRTEIEVTMLMSKTLKTSLGQLRHQNDDQGNYIVFADQSMLTSSYGDLNDLNSCCRDGQKVVLTYYLP